MSKSGKGGGQGGKRMKKPQFGFGQSAGGSDFGLEPSSSSNNYKLEPISPNQNKEFGGGGGGGGGGGTAGFSRCSSNGSINTLSSSAHNSDDDDDDESEGGGGGGGPSSYRERRREAHTMAEQKRRDSIKKGYDALTELVPTCTHNDTLSGYKLSKATVLQKSIDYVEYLLQQKKKQEDELAGLRKEVVALQIMKVNYEQIAKAHQSQPGHISTAQVPDEVKFQVFQAIMSSLFHSFSHSLSVVNFTEISACVFSWLEEYCKPQTLRDMVIGILQQLKNQF